MRTLIPVLLVGIAAAAAEPVFAADATRGKKQYEYWCGTCHGRIAGEGGRPLPGTMSLQNKYAGARPAILEDRDDLVPVYVKQVIRKGSEGMPFFRKTEISDAEMEDIAAYLARSSK